MQYPNNDSVEYTIKTTWNGTPVLCYREAFAGESGSFYWSPWRKAKPEHINQVIKILNEEERTL